jgi:3-isopropylmalate/(R)-2-methylmalate dehydratase small subunit
MKKMTRGKVFKYGDNVDTDVIIPARYLNTTDDAELAPHCMEDLDPGFASQVCRGDIIVAGKNFGCGSSREHAPLTIRAAGVSCVIASSFARIFYRNALNIGLAILECDAAAEAIQHHDVIELDLGTGIIRRPATGDSWQARPFPPFASSIIAAGGLMASLKGQSPSSC